MSQNLEPQPLSDDFGDYARAPTPRETADHAELAAIISDEEIVRVHGHANFGEGITPREVVNDGVRKYAVGYHSGHTQLCILMEHGLITKPRPGSYDANLTKKGKRYARVLYRSQSALLSEIATLRGQYELDSATIQALADRLTQAERQRDEALEAARKLSAAINWTDYPFIDNNTSREELISRLGFMQKDAEQPRAFLANQGASQ